MELTVLGTRDYFDLLLVLAAGVAPLWLVARFGGFGVLLGAVVNWLIIIADVWLITPSGVQDPFALFGIDAWLPMGWIVGLVYAGLLYAALRGWQWIFRQRPRRCRDFRV